MEFCEWLRIFVGVFLLLFLSPLFSCISTFYSGDILTSFFLIVSMQLLSSCKHQSSILSFPHSLSSVDIQAQQTKKHFRYKDLSAVYFHYTWVCHKLYNFINTIYICGIDEERKHQAAVPYFLAHDTRNFEFKVKKGIIHKYMFSEKKPYLKQEHCKYTQNNR